MRTRAKAREVMWNIDRRYAAEGAWRRECGGEVAARIHNAGALG